MSGFLNPETYVIMPEGGSGPRTTFAIAKVKREGYRDGALLLVSRCGDQMVSVRISTFPAHIEKLCEMIKGVAAGDAIDEADLKVKDYGAKPAR